MERGQLTFSDNHFVVSGIFRNEHVNGWVQSATDKFSFSTRNIKAALRFRDLADAKAENIFRKLMLRTHAPPSERPFAPKGYELMPFQAELGVPHILTRSRSYLAHEPGLGKSAQFITAASMKPGRTLIICPSFLKTTWAREITKWSHKDFPSIQIVPETANRFLMDWRVDFVICSDSMLLKEWVRDALYAQRFRHVGIDEAHRFKTPNSSRTVALFGGQNKTIKSKGLIYRAEHVSFLSGTPMLNRPIELWPILFGAAPELIDFMSYEEFGFEYCGATQVERGRWLFLGSRNEDELKKRIMGGFMQRITKRQVLPELPAKIREAIIIDEDPRKKEVVAMDKSLLERLKIHGDKEVEMLTELGDYARVRHANGVSKIPWVVKYISSILSSDPDESVILYAHHRDVVAQLSAELSLFKPCIINGGVKEVERTKIQDLFQSGVCRLIIGNIDAMNLGLTLTRATRVAFAEYAWTPEANKQAEDRANRIGSKWSVFCQYLVLPNSIDEKILSLLLEKEKRIAKVIG